MKICLACNKRFSSDSWQCLSCHSHIQLIDNFLSFSPELAFTNPGFKSIYYEKLVQLEEQNFWFRARNHLICWALGHYFPSAASFFEIGCGTGFVLSGINQNFPHLNLFGSEILSAGLDYTNKRVKNTTFFQMDARQIPFENEFDVIGAFDVLEHIDEDEIVLQQMYQALHKVGGIIITVPQHPFLWSSYDVNACHIRRYKAKELKMKVVKAGFKVIKITSFVTFLLPLMLGSRLFRSKSNEKNHDLFSEFKIPYMINGFFEKILNLERLLIQKGISLPVGGSLLLVAKKE